MTRQDSSLRMPLCPISPPMSQSPEMTGYGVPFSPSPRNQPQATELRLSLLDLLLARYIEYILCPHASFPAVFITLCYSGCAYLYERHGIMYHIVQEAYQLITISDEIAQSYRDLETRLRPWSRPFNLIPNNHVSHSPRLARQLYQGSTTLAFTVSLIPDRSPARRVA